MFSFPKQNGFKQLSFDSIVLDFFSSLLSIGNHSYFFVFDSKLQICCVNMLISSVVQSFCALLWIENAETTRRNGDSIPIYSYSHGEIMAISEEKNHARLNVLAF